MPIPHGGGTSVAPGQDSDLARLITLEQRLSAQLESAHAAHAALRAEARRDAGAELDALNRELEALIARLTGEAQAATAARIQALEAEGAAQCRRWDALEEVAIARLARDLLAWLLAPEEARR